jgi:hypothetical protein
MAFRESKRGEIVLRPKGVDVRALRGCIRYDGPALSLEEIDAAVAKELRDELIHMRLR